MKAFLLLTLFICLIAMHTDAQEQRVTAKIRKQSSEHNAAIDQGLKGNTPAAPNTPATATTPAKKDPISDLPTAEKVVKYQLNVVKQAKARNDAATKNRDTLHATYKGKNLDSKTYAAVMKQYDAADKEIANSDKALATARAAFDILYGKYQGFGGTNDYRSQLP